MKILFDQKVYQAANNSLNQIESNLAKVGTSYDTNLHCGNKKWKHYWNPLSGLKREMTLAPLPTNRDVIKWYTHAQSWILAKGQ